MLKPPSLKRLLNYPATASLGLGALAVSLLWWSGRPIGGLVMNEQVWRDWEFQRAFTSVLPHVTLYHLAFNLYWLWAFGSLIEGVFGQARTVAIFLLLAFTSGTLEYAFLHGGVGLSGIGYGLWGLLQVLQKHDGRFLGAVDRKTSQYFVGWFLLCILLTVTGVMPVANIAHGVGALTGALIGLALSREVRTKITARACLAALVAFGVAGSTVLYPDINLSGDASLALERAGLQALQEGDPARAVKHLETASRMRNAPARVWFDLGIAWQRQNRLEEALRCYEKAAGMPDATADIRGTAKDMRAYLDQVGME